MRKGVFVLSLGLLTALLAPVTHAAAPVAPSGVTTTSASLAGAAQNQAQVAVSWERAVTGALGYVVTATAAGQTTVSKTITPGTLTSTILEGLSGGVSYSFTVAAKNVDGETAAPAVTFVPRTVAGSPTVAAPVVAKGQVTLSWTAPTNTGGVELTGYSITAAGVASETPTASATSAVIIGLTNGGKYDFTIRALNSIGSSAAASFATATVPDRPGVPTSLTASVSSSTIATTWVAPINSGGSAITSYIANLFDSNGGEITAQRKTVTTAAADFTGLAAGTYTVKVSAVNLVGESDKTAATSPQIVAATSALTANEPVISPATINDLPIDSTVNVTATAPSGGAVTVTVSPSSVCTLVTSTGVVTGVSAGTCSITASIGQSGNFESGATSKNFNVVKVAQSINFPTISPQTMSASVTVSATSSSGSPVTFTASGNCTISGSTVTLTSAGSCTVTANASATTKFLAASPAIRTFTIAAAPEVSSGGGGGFSGGGFAGGGGFPFAAPAASPSPTPSPTPSPSASPTPTPSATASPTPSPSTSPTPSASPSPTPSPSASPTPTPNPSVPLTPFKANTYLAVAPKNTPTTKLTLSTASKALTISSGKAVGVSLPSVPKGTTVVTTMKTPDGKTIQVASVKTTKAGAYSIPSLQLKKPGTYTLQIKIGKVIRTVKVTVKK